MSNHLSKKKDSFLKLVESESKRIIYNHDGSTEPLLGYAIFKCGLVVELNPYEDQALFILDVKDDKIHKIPVPISGGTIICKTASDPELAIDIYNKSIEERALWMNHESTKEMYMERTIIDFHIFS